MSGLIWLARLPVRLRMLMRLPRPLREWLLMLKAWPSSELMDLVPVLLKGNDLVFMHSHDPMMVEISAAAACTYSRMLGGLQLMHKYLLIQVQAVSCFE